MVAPTGDNEQVRYDILIESKQAITALREMLRYTQDNTTKMLEFSNMVIEQSKRWGMSLQQTVDIYRQLNAELAKSKKGTLFGQTGGQDLFGQADKYLESLQKSGRITDGISEGANTVANGLNQMGEAGEKAGNKIGLGMHFARIALGALVAMIVFNVISAFQNLFRMAIKGLEELETATYNLANAERTLSEQGINIVPKDFDKMIAQLQKLDPLLSKIQATELVSSLSTKVAPAVGLTKDEIQQLAQSIAILSIRNKGLGKSFEEVESQVENAFLSGKVSTGINQLGIKITDQIVKDEALRLGLVSTAKEFDNLTGKMEANIKARAMISLLTANTNKDLAHLPDFFKTADAAFGIFQARLQDLMTTFGQKFAPLLKAIFMDLADLLTRMLDYIEKNGEAFDVFVTGLTVLARGVFALIELFLKLQMAIGKAGASLYEFFSRIPGMKQLMDAVGGPPPAQDTPTSSTSDFASSEEQQNQERLLKAQEEYQNKLQDIMKDSADKKLDIERDYQRKLYDINRDYNYKLEDIARNTAQKREDALRNYNQKVEDINRDAEQKIADAQAEANKKKIDKEQEFQNRLRELREKFLFDLEDALRERDARQVLRLIRQYNMDKKNLEERHKLDQEQAKKDLKDKLAQIELERQQKLEAAKRDYDERLKEIAIGEQRELAEARLWKQRQLEDARLWHQRQLQEQQQYLQRKLRDLADALRAEYNLTSQGMQAINSLLAAGYNLPSGYTPVSANGAVTGGSSNGAFASFSDTFNQLTGGAGYGFAEGGSLIATRPTRALFGEKGPERVDITPLNRPGNNVGKMFGDKSGMGGDVKILLQLSPDLEARIVDSSMENIAVHLERIVRSK